MPYQQPGEAPRVVKFGLDQLKNPTPLAAKVVLRTVAFLSGVWAILPQDMLGIHDDLYARINKWIIVGNAVILFAIKFFGWQRPEDN